MGVRKLVLFKLNKRLQIPGAKKVTGKCTTIFSELDKTILSTTTTTITATILLLLCIVLY